jgi:hypothetical protein
MVADRRHPCAGYLALVSVLSWPTVVIGVRDTPDAPKTTTQGMVFACDPGALIPALLNERKPVVKSERAGLDGAATPVAVRAVAFDSRVPLCPTRDASRPACGRRSRCALLCRFLV